MSPLGYATDVLSNGGIIACPTESIWGLSCDPDNDGAIRRLLELKNRPLSYGFILVAADISQFSHYMHALSPALRQKLRRSWPGPRTWLIPHNGLASQLICGDHSTLALRVTNHPLLRSVCEYFGGPIISTSANINKKPPCRSYFQVYTNFHSRIDYIVPGRCGLRRNPTPICDAENNHLIRSQ